MKVLVTGAAGFIGFHLVKRLLAAGCEVLGLDELNAYYNPQLKWDRLAQLGITPPLTSGKPIESAHYPGFAFVKDSSTDIRAVRRVFEHRVFDKVCHLAAQAGVRYSLENPDAYVQCNLLGFFNVLQTAADCGCKHFVYASSSSVYGASHRVPFDVAQPVDKPLSLYAATKKSNELLAHAYSHLHHLPTTGLRFFTIYGPWGRPDMAYFSFADKIQKGLPIPVFNRGALSRDMTYIDDAVEATYRILSRQPKSDYAIYNIGKSDPVDLTKLIEALEKTLGKRAIKEMKPMQPGDVYQTHAHVDQLMKDYGYKPQTPLSAGVQHFVDWYLTYHQLR